MTARRKLDAAAGRSWDVVVVGAGPAGAVAARQLARLGNEVLLVDKARFPRFKVCGGCLSVGSLTSLQAVGLGDLASDLGAVALHEMVWAAGGRQARIGLPGGASLSRQRLDEALVRAAVDEGVELLEGVTARLSEASSVERFVRLADETQTVTVAARVVLLASGLGSRTSDDDGPDQVADASLLGAGVIVDEAPADYAPGAIYMACGRGGYVGLVRVENQRLNVAAAFDPALVRRCHGLAGAAADLLQQAGLPPVAALAAAAWKGTPLLTRKAPSVAGQRVFLLGDAAGYVEPFTGEGMAWALAAGQAVVPLADRGCRQWSGELAAQWRSLHGRLVSRRQWVCRSLARLLRHPRLTRAAVRAVSTCPALSGPVVFLLNRGPRAKLPQAGGPAPPRAATRTTEKLPSHRHDHQGSATWD